MARLPYYKATLVFSVLWVAIGSASCRRRQVSVPLSRPPAPSARRPTPEPQPLPPPPAIGTPAPSPASTAPPVQAQEPPATYQVNKPAPAASKKPARSSPAPAVAPAASTAASSPAPAPAAVAPPRLGDVLTDDQEKQYSASIDQSLSRADASLNALNTRQLNKDQQSEVEQIRSFMQQAKSTRGSDPAGAKSLAERAEVLARDLAASFK